MKIITVYLLIERLLEFYDDNEFISEKELNNIFNDCVSIEESLLIDKGV